MKGTTSSQEGSPTASTPSKEESIPTGQDTDKESLGHSNKKQGRSEDSLQSQPQEQGSGESLANPRGH